MITHIWSVLCSRSIIDRDTNNISLLDVLEQLAITPTPEEGEVARIPINCEIVTLWSRTPQDQPVRGYTRLLFLGPSGVQVGEGTELEIDLSAYPRTRMRTRMNELQFREAGTHVFRVQLRDDPTTEWRDVASIPLQIIFRSDEQTRQSTE